jgi:hypothetical protein
MDGGLLHSAGGSGDGALRQFAPGSPQSSLRVAGGYKPPSMDGMFSVPAPYSGNSSGNGAGAGAGAGNGNTPAGLQFKPPSIDTSMISMGANGAGTCDTSGDAWRLPSALSLSL